MKVTWKLWSLDWIFFEIKKARELSHNMRLITTLKLSQSRYLSLIYFLIQYFFKKEKQTHYLLSFKENLTSRLQFVFSTYIICVTNFPYCTSDVRSVDFHLGTAIRSQIIKDWSFTYCIIQDRWIIEFF